VGVVNIVGGVPNPGIQTDSKSGALLMGSIIFKAKKTGTAKIGLSDGNSAIYSNVNNINILTVTKGTIEVPIQDVQPSPTPTPQPLSCSDISVTGAIEGKAGGTTIYIVDSEGKANLKAYVTPENSKVAWTGWNSVNLPNGGTWNPSDSPITVWTAPKNTGNQLEGVQVKADIANTSPVVSCKPVNMAVKPAPQSTPSPTPSSSSTSTRVFVTSTTYNGNLGGLSGADAKCQTVANNANLGGVWKAWLSDSVTSAASRLNHSNGPYQLLNGTTIANNWIDLTGGSINHAINLSEYKSTVEAGNVWTNTTRTGEINKDISIQPANCQNWTDGIGDGTRGSIGSSWSGSTDYHWTESGYDYCGPNQSKRLFCFEQTSVPSTTYSFIEFLEAFGSKKDDPKYGANYNAKYDVNQDGQIDIVDFSGLLGKFDPNTTKLKTGFSTSELLSTYGKKQGDASFNAKYDVNTDNVINKADYTILNTGTSVGSGDGNNDGKVDYIDLSILLSDFNKTSGFRPGIDMNGDGVINTFDYVLLKNLLIKNGVIKG